MEIGHKALTAFTWVLISILGIILVFSTAELLVVVIRTVINRVSVYDFSQTTINPNDLFLVMVQDLIAGVLLITIIIELIHSLLASLDKSRKNNYLEILIEIAIIAVIRHLFIYELDHLNGITIIGIASLLLVLGGFYLFYKFYKR